MRLLVILSSIAAVAFAFPSGPAAVQQDLSSAPAAPAAASVPGPANTFFFTPFVGMPPMFHAQAQVQPSLVPVQHTQVAHSHQKSQQHVVPVAQPQPQPQPQLIPLPLPVPQPQLIPQVQHQVTSVQSAPQAEVAPAAIATSGQEAQSANLVQASAGVGQQDISIQAQQHEAATHSHLVELARAYTDSNLRLAQAYRDAEIRLAAANQKEASEALLAQAIAGANSAGNVQLLNWPGQPQAQVQAQGGASGDGSSSSQNGGGGSGDGSSQNGGGSGDGSSSQNGGGGSGDGSSSSQNGGSSGDGSSSSQNGGSSGDGSSSSQNGSGSADGSSSHKVASGHSFTHAIGGPAHVRPLISPGIPFAFPFQFLQGLPGPVPIQGHVPVSHATQKGR